MKIYFAIGCSCVDVKRDVEIYLTLNCSFCSEEYLEELIDYDFEDVIDKLQFGIFEKYGSQYLIDDIPHIYEKLKNHQQIDIHFNCY